MIGWGHTIKFVWGEKEQEKKYRAQSWLGVWGLANWIYVTCCQAEYSQWHKSHLSFRLLTGHFVRSDSILGLESYFSGTVDYSLISCTFLCEGRPSGNKQQTLLLRIFVFFFYLMMVRLSKIFLFGLDYWWQHWGGRRCKDPSLLLY